MKKSRKHPHPHHTIALLATGVMAIVAGGILLWAGSLRLPDFDIMADRVVRQSTKIYDRTGEVLLYDLHEDVRRTVLPFENISQYIKDATVSIEDARFYEHNGIRPLSFIRAVFANLLSFSYSQGGSTITQQVVKNALLTKEKLISRKIKEWVLAVKLEQTLSKDEILALYLNESPYGGNMYGVQEATHLFFGKDASDVTLAEAAYIAAIPQAPTFYSPYGNNTDRLDERKNLVLEQMYENNYITKEEMETAQAEVVTFNERPEKGILAPHFVFYVREYLQQKYGTDTLETAGLKVITSLDYDIQQKAEDIVHEGAMENAEKFKAENMGLVAVDPKTGEILAMVGSRDYFDEEIDGQVNIATAKRQPGSSFKPFVYATAFMKGLTPETVVFDLPTQFSTACQPSDKKTQSPCYYPENYDGQFRGPMTLRSALAQSINIPAVKALYIAGISDSIRTARNMGISTLADAARYGLTLVLGGGEVTLLEITSAYGVFANDGLRNPATPIVRIEKPDGTILEESTPTQTRVLDENVARQISDVLSDNVARTPSYGANSALYFANRDVAAKTGTTNDYRDVWIVGYTPNLAVGMWAGNNDNTPIDKSVAGFVIAPVWRRFMDATLPNRPTEYFINPSQESVSKPVLAGIWQGGEVVRTNNTSTTVRQNVHDILHWISRADVRGSAPTNPNSDPQYKYWEYPVQVWAVANGHTSGGTITVAIPLKETVDGEVEDEIKTTSTIIRVSGLRSRYDDDDTLSFTIRALDDDFEYAEIKLNNTILKNKTGTGRISIPLETLTTLPEVNTLTVTAYTEDGRTQILSSQFSIR